MSSAAEKTARRLWIACVVCETGLWYTWLMETPLLQTKLYIPPLRPELVPRPRLIERLNASLRRSGGFARKLTLISKNENVSALFADLRFAHLLFSEQD